MSQPATSRGATRRLIAIAVLGVGLVAAPAIFQMFDRGPKGAEMMRAFKPYMTDARLAGFQLDIRQIDDGVREADTKAAATLEGRGAAAHARFDRRFGDFARFSDEWPAIHADMKHLLDTIQDNAGNYRAMVALPSFELFPWFFVIPGVLLAIVGAAGLAARRLRAPARWTALAVGVALLVAPFALGIFGAAPKGGRMMSAFETLETRKKVETMQGYFSSVAVGQGALRIDVVPALREQGLSAAQVAARFPALTTLDERWVPILNDLTPMIGTMSDNVDNYQAIAALPPFPLFPWFFIVPGLLVAALALGPRARFTRAYLPVRNKEPVT